MEHRQIGSELFFGAKDDARKAEALRSFDIGGYVVNVQGVFCVHFAGLESGTIDEGIRLADANGAGIDAMREVAEEIVGGFEMGDVDGVGKIGRAHV